MKTFILAATLAAMASSLAYAGDGTPAPDTGKAGPACKQAGQGGQASQGKKTDCYTDGQIADRLHATNLHEIRAANLALEASENDEVREFARMMIDHHSAADKKVAAFASSRDLTLSEPKPLDSKERAEMEKMEAAMEKLESLEGKAFDAYYAKHMVASHAKTLDKLELFAKSTSTEELDALLADITPTVEKHLEEARDLVKSVD